MSCDDPKDLLFPAWKYQGFNYLSFEGSAKKSEGTSYTCKEVEEKLKKKCIRKKLFWKLFRRFFSLDIYEKFFKICTRKTFFLGK